MAGILVSPVWLTSDDCFSDVKELDKILADLPLPDIASTAQPLSHTCTATSGRFGTTFQSELQCLQQKNVNSNTKKSTKTWVNRLQKWQDNKGIQAVLNASSLPSLNSWWALHWQRTSKLEYCWTCDTALECTTPSFSYSSMSLTSLSKMALRPLVTRKYSFWV